MTTTDVQPRPLLPPGSRAGLADGRLLRGLGFVDVGSGALGLVAASWLARQLDLDVAGVRLISGFLVALGLAKVVFCARPAMTRLSIGIEASFALGCLVVVVDADPTTIGTALLLATSAMCLTASTLLAVVDRRAAGR